MLSIDSELLPRVSGPAADVCSLDAVPLQESSICAAAWIAECRNSSIVYPVQMLLCECASICERRLGHHVRVIACSRCRTIHAQPKQYAHYLDAIARSCFRTELRWCTVLDCRNFGQMSFSIARWSSLNLACSVMESVWLWHVVT